MVVTKYTLIDIDITTQLVTCSKVSTMEFDHTEVCNHCRRTFTSLTPEQTFVLFRIPWCLYTQLLCQYYTYPPCACRLIGHHISHNLWDTTRLSFQMPRFNLLSDSLIDILTLLTPSPHINTAARVISPPSISTHHSHHCAPIGTP